MILVNSTFGYFVALTLLAAGLYFGIRTNYLLTPPSDITVAVSKSLLENPQEWEMGSVDTVLTNSDRSLQINMFGGVGSIQVRKGQELVPTLENSMNLFFSTHNQNYLHRAMVIWKKQTAPTREARIVNEIS